MLIISLHIYKIDLPSRWLLALLYKFSNKSISLPGLRISTPSDAFIEEIDFTIIYNLQDKFMISVDEYCEDIEIKDVSILGSFGYIKTG